MKISMKKSLCFIFALALALCFIGCNGNPQGGEEPKDYVTAKTWGTVKVNSVRFDSLDNDVMPIVGYIGPTRGVTTWGDYDTGENPQYIPSLATDEMFALIEEAGVNMIAGQGDNIGYSKAEHDSILEMMDIAAEHGISYFVKDTSVINVESGFITTENLSDAMADYINHPAFAGLYFRDEPKADVVMQNIATATEEFYMGIGNRKLHPYVNLYPYVYYGSLAKYEEYLDAFMETEPRYISYDHYPFTKQDGYMGPHYFTNLSVIKKYADNYKIPFWSFMQSCGKNQDDSSLRNPTEGELIYQVNTTLAYGAKGIKWFPLFHPHYWTKSAEEGNVGLFYCDGTPTPFFDIAKRANTFIASIDHVLMNAQNVGIIYEGTSPVATANYAAEKIQSKQFRELIKVEGASAMIGCFDYKGKTALYVVNNSISEGSTVKLTFDNKYKYDIYRESGLTQEKGTELTFEFGIGEAALVTLY